MCDPMNNQQSCWKEGSWNRVRTQTPYDARTFRAEADAYPICESSCRKNKRPVCEDGAERSGCVLLRIRDPKTNFLGWVTNESEVTQLTSSSKQGLDVLRKSHALIRPSTPPVAMIFRSYLDQSHASTSVGCAASLTTGLAGWELFQTHKAWSP